MLFYHNLRSLSSPSHLFCCFHDGCTLAAAAYHEIASSNRDDGGHPCKVRTAALELPLPEIWYRCHNLITRIGRCRWRPGHAAVAAVASSKFEYDPMSYALNFEDDLSQELNEEFPARNFSVRLLRLRIGCCWRTRSL